MTHLPSLPFAPSSSMGSKSVWASGLLVLWLLILVAGDQGELGLQRAGGGVFTLCSHSHGSAGMDEALFIPEPFPADPLARSTK